MPRQKQIKPDPTELAIQRAGSIGDLERLAGIEQTVEARTAFWLTYSNIHPAGASLDAGVAELKRRIRAAACRPQPS